MQTELPIVVLSFNRPDYLRNVLESLRLQVDFEIDSRNIYLFQDGHKNDYSGIEHTSSELVAENIRVFKEIIPFGIVMASRPNLGIALNFDRAEKFIFEVIRAEAGIFLEDDLVLGNQYLSTLSKLVKIAIECDRIGYVCAYGQHTLSREQQIENLSKLQIMGHNWAFGLTRKQWLKQKLYVEQYIDIVRNVDYRLRNHDAIVDLFHSWGLGCPGTSQDIAKSHACILTNTAKLNTVACFGRYIGQLGVHFDEATFTRMGFGNTEMVEDVVFDPEIPSSEYLDKIISVAHYSAMQEIVKKKDEGLKRDFRTINASLVELRGSVEKSLIDCNYVKAKHFAEKGLAIYPWYRDKYSHPYFLKQLIKASLLLNERNDADYYSSKLADCIPVNDPCVSILYARFFSSIGDDEVALEFWKEVLKVDPLNKEAYKYIGGK